LIYQVFCITLSYCINEFFQNVKFIFNDESIFLLITGKKSFAI